MEQLEKVEKIREKTGVTYEEAKKALEENNWNVLDAIVSLEAQGKMKEPQSAKYSTQSDENIEFTKAAEHYEKTSKHMSLGEMTDKFLGWCGKIAKKSCENFFEVKRKGKEIVTMPVLVLVLLLFFAFWVVVPLLLVGLFCDFSYSFRGEITEKVDLNKACDFASETCENIKQELNKAGESASETCKNMDDLFE